MWNPFILPKPPKQQQQKGLNPWSCIERAFTGCHSQAVLLLSSTTACPMSFSSSQALQTPHATQQECSKALLCVPALPCWLWAVTDSSESWVALRLGKNHPGTVLSDAAGKGWDARGWLSLRTTGALLQQAVTFSLCYIRCSQIGAAVPCNGIRHRPDAWDWKSEAHSAHHQTSPCLLLLSMLHKPTGYWLQTKCNHAQWLTLTQTELLAATWFSAIWMLSDWRKQKVAFSHIVSLRPLKNVFGKLLGNKLGETAACRTRERNVLFFCSWSILVLQHCVSATFTPSQVSRQLRPSCGSQRTTLCTLG